MQDFSYQIKAADRVLKDAMSGNYIASVLAVAPGGGKTTISHHIINTYIGMLPDAKVLVLTEGQNTLRNQYLSELKNPNVKINFTFGDFSSDAQVRVGIPQSINQISWNSVDMIVVDEAHNFYLEPMVQDIIKKLNPTVKVLMTGSPTKYNLHNQTSKKKYAMYYISAEELQKMGVFSAVDVDVVKTSSKSVSEVLSKVLADAFDKEDRLDKIMVACPTIACAKEAAKFLSSVGRNVSLSTSENDKNDEEIQRFKSNLTNTLIVVGKGVLGFNDSMITLMIDLRSSSNIDASYQLFARVLRRHPQNLKKAYFRVGLGDEGYVKQVVICHKMLALMKKEVYKGYNGKNLRVEAY